MLSRPGSVHHSSRSIKLNDGVPATYLKCMQQSNVGVRPEDKELLNAYAAYKTSSATRALQSEIDKTMYADAIIDPPGLAPLSYLCIKALAKVYTPNELADIVTKDPFIMRTYYDTLDIDLPLEKCYYIDDEQYWYRYVSTRHKDPSLQIKKLNWKNIGITMKFVQYLQQLPAEFWNEEAISALAEKINRFVTDLHIEHLQTVHETRLLRHLREDDIGSTSSSDSSTYLPSSSESDGVGEVYVTNEDSSEPSNNKVKYNSAERRQSKISSRTSAVSGARGVSTVSLVTTWSYGLKSIDASGSWYDKRRALCEKEIRKDKRQTQRAKQKRRQERRARRALLEEREDLEHELANEVAEEKAARVRLATKREARGKKTDEMVSVFEMEVDPSQESNIFKDECDKRNPAKVKQRHKALQHPLIAEHCHHYNLQFLSNFPFLTTLIIEFNGPLLSAKHEDWHFDFSTRDIERLADGIRSLNILKVFSLRNSRMSAKKLYILARSLKNIFTLQSVDFSYDNLKDDCGDGLYELFQNTLSIKSLELAGNEIGDALCDLAIALGGYEGTCQYLGLGGNRLGLDALRILCYHIINTSQVRELCLRGAMLPQTAISYCIGQQLLPKHAILRSIDISAIPIEYDTASELLKGLKNNHKIRKFDIRGCNLPADLELDFEILLKRNKFLFSYPAIGNIRKSIEYIDGSISKTRNKILLRASEAVKARAECLANRPKAYVGYDELKREGPAETSSQPSSLLEENSSESFVQDDRTSSVQELFTKDPNTFSEEEIKSRFWFFETPNKQLRANEKRNSFLLNSD